VGKEEKVLKIQHGGTAGGHGGLEAKPSAAGGYGDLVLKTQPLKKI